MTETEISIADKVTYIKNIVGSLSLEERQDILQMLLNSSIDEKKLQSKGSGTQIAFKHIPENVIDNIYRFINQKLTLKKEEIEHFPDEDSN